MIVTLHRKQRVCVGSRIHFQHCADSGRRHEIILNTRQFENLNDIIVCLHKYQPLRHFPLGGGLWLLRKGNSVKIIDNYNNTFFRFYANALHFYITHVHDSLYSYLCNGKSNHHQSDAKYETQLRYSHRRSSSCRKDTPFHNLRDPRIGPNRHNELSFSHQSYQ